MLAIPAAVLSLLPLIGKVAPGLLSILFQGHAPVVVTRLEAALQDVFGTNDPQAVQAAADADPSKLDQLKARLDADTAELQASLADVQSARAAQSRLVELHSRLQWVPAVLSLIITVGFFATLYATLYFVFLFPKNDLTVNQVAVLTGMLGVLTASFVQVCNYWLGTSSGAAKRGDQAIFAAYDAQPSRRLSS